MRRQMMKQPSGPVVSASPTPARMARTKKSSNMALSCRVLVIVAVMVIAASMAVVMAMAGVVMPCMVVKGVIVPVMTMVVTIVGVAVIGDGAVGMQHPAIGQMRMIVVVAVDRKRLRRTAAEQANI